MFRSHFISMVIFAFIAAGLIALTRHSEKKAFYKYALKLFLYMIGSVIAISWFMHFL
jgi:hypothetical protein